MYEYLNHVHPYLGLSGYSAADYLGAQNLNVYAAAAGCRNLLQGGHPGGGQGGHPGGGGSKPDPRISVELENEIIWKQFHKFDTEMIITKLGRRMFPTVKISVKGLDPNAKYFVLMDVIPADEHRYKFQNKEWTIASKAEPHVYGRLYIHPHSPASGSQWMKHSISFEKLKLTNNNMDQQGHIIVCSMHKYLPRIHIVQASEFYQIHYATFNTFSFPETRFLAVTAYQNENITQLKINHNPFAKGFRENGHTKNPKKRASSKSPPHSSISSSVADSSHTTADRKRLHVMPDQSVLDSDYEDRPHSNMSTDMEEKIDVETLLPDRSPFLGSAAIIPTSDDERVVSEASPFMSPVSLSHTDTESVLSGRSPFLGGHSSPHSHTDVDSDVSERSSFGSLSDKILTSSGSDRSSSFGSVLQRSTFGSESERSFGSSSSLGHSDGERVVPERSPFLSPVSLPSPNENNNSLSDRSPFLSAPQYPSTREGKKSSSSKNDNMKTSSKTENIGLPSSYPLLSPQSYAHSAPGNNPLDYHYLHYYSQLMNPYMLGQNPHGHPLPFSPNLNPLNKATIAVRREMYHTLSPYLRQNPLSLQPTPLPARPTPIFPFQRQYQPQIPTHL